MSPGPGERTLQNTPAGPGSLPDLRRRQAHCPEPGLAAGSKDGRFARSRGSCRYREAWSEARRFSSSARGKAGRSETGCPPLGGVPRESVGGRNRSPFHTSVRSLAGAPDLAPLHDATPEKGPYSLDSLALDLLSAAFGMSRSFVRAWATVATIMAMVCFAFVQPMPEHSTRAAGENPGFAEFSVPDTGNVSETPPFVDSVLSGKTFTPYVTISASPELHMGAPRSFQQGETLLDLRSPPPDPLIRPG